MRNFDSNKAAKTDQEYKCYERIACDKIVRKNLANYALVYHCIPEFQLLSYTGIAKQAI